MKTLEFEAAVNPDSTVTLPPEIAAQVPGDHPVRVILVVEEQDDGADWKRAAAEQFLNGYDEGDAIYDQLPPR
jgi:hypothetical protein